MNIPFKVICIRDTGKPNEIPTSKWIELGKDYTVIEIMRCNVQGGLLGFKLEEIDLTGCEPYLYFSYDRFAVPTEETVTEHEEELAVA